MGMFDDLLKPQANTSQPSAPVAPKSTGLFKDFLAPQELEETAVLTQDERLPPMAVVSVSDDVYGNISFDPNAGIVGALKRGIEAPGAVL